MPNKDGTWPNGKWSGTGRWLWNCKWKTTTQDNKNVEYGKKNGQWCGQGRWNGNGGRKCQN